ncbi:uncharacterized protein LOC101891327 isoform X2 [Musca domestica]|uniref:Uncharacterized protein LOC101891327 isoform X2 n=1 Tax=Musca domestica TaxID=7370 RepID=A0ABM3UZ20_MUSDO|nr:uncharacterized protein LOC101891327 isoform X2 [Musca domestica]
MNEMALKLKKLNSNQFINETNSEQYHYRANRKSFKLKMMSECGAQRRDCGRLSKSKEMLNHLLLMAADGQSCCNENQLSGTIIENSSSNNSNNDNNATIRTCLSGLQVFESKLGDISDNNENDSRQHQHVRQHQPTSSHPPPSPPASSLHYSHCKQRRLRPLQQCQYRQHYQDQQQQKRWLLFGLLYVVALFSEYTVPLVKADQNTKDANPSALYGNVDSNMATTPLTPVTTLPTSNDSFYTTTTTTFSPSIMAINETTSDWLRNDSSRYVKRKFKSKFNADDSIFLRFAKRFAHDNNLVSGIIQECYQRPTFACFQKNVYVYLNEVLDAQDVNVTQRLKFYRNDNVYDEQAELDEDMAAEAPSHTTQASAAKDSMEEDEDQNNEIPREGRSYDNEDAAMPETPIEEVTNALYGKSIKFAMTHNIELKLPEMMFDGATFRISPKSIEGNGVIAKLELIPKQKSEARLAGKILMKKLQKLMKSKLLLSFLALVLIIKIIKIKLFWLLPLVIGVGAAKKLLLKFLLFLFPALSHLFKLCSYYQQTYHSTKYHHHHHHINHHHTIVPPWHSGESAPWHSAETAHIPEIIYSHPPKGHVSTYLHGAPIHETYGPPHEHIEAWENSGPGLGSDIFNHKYRNNPVAAQSAPSPVYTPARQPGLPQLQKQLQPQIQEALSTAAQIAAQYDPTRKQPQQQQSLPTTLQESQLTPELSAQIKEALRIQAEQRLVQQQQQILDKQPFVQDGQPLMPLNYDPFYSPILLKIDKIIEQLGIKEEGCKERVVCSMYKDPERYSPHSNFVSAELSRDTNELQPITSTNPAVIRFFRLIQAARDGQDHKNCLTLYPDCNINTE